MSVIRETHEVSLDTIGSGAAIERCQVAMHDVLNNILDPNTDPKKKRAIIIKLEFAPDENREFTKVAIHTEKKLAPILPVSTQIFIGRDKNGHGVASEFTPAAQTVITDAMPSNVTPIKPQEAAQQ